MRTIPLILAAAIAAAPAAAQYGRLVPTDRIVALARRSCLADGDYQRAIPAIAKRERWDEYGKRPGTPATSRAWLVALSGQPAVVDVRVDGATTRCAVSAVSDPSAIARAVETLVGRPADSTTHPAGGSTRVWRAAGGHPAVEVTSPPGEALTRVAFSHRTR